MKFYPVTPPGLLTALPRQWKHHLVLADQVLKDPAYEEYFASIRRNEALNGSSGLKVILDNPVHERLDTPPLDARMRAARSVKAHTVVAPDRIGDAKASTSLLRIHMRSSLAQRYGTMAVVQGKTADQYFTHIVELAKIVSYVGIPQIRSGAPFSRSEFIYRLLESGFFEQYPQVKIHLLGNIGLFQDAIELRAVPQVIGIDSAKPIYMGAMGIDLRATCSASDPDIHRPPNFFSWKAEDFAPGNLALIRRNIETVQEWVDGC